MLPSPHVQVMEAEEMKKGSEVEHRVRADDFTRAEKSVHELERNLRREIDKSRPYFQMKDKLNLDLQAVKSEIENLQKSIGEAKRSVSESLRSLECISEEIHERRNGRGVRTPGVGAEHESSSASPSSSPSSSLSGRGGAGDVEECRRNGL
jgi:SMC interacting uncharacterized protein involved in chromosome segregation